MAGVATPERYDAFISYRRVDPDQHYAKQVAERLKASGLTVAFDHWDFDPAVEALTEMDRCVLESRFTLAVVTPNYVKDSHALLEATIRRSLDLQAGSRSLILLKFERADLPGWLGPLTGIDFACQDPDPWTRLLDKLRSTPVAAASAAAAAVAAAIGEELAFALSRYLPEAEQFLLVSRRLRLGLEALAASRTSLCRWEAAVAVCAQRNWTAALAESAVAQPELLAVPRAWLLARQIGGSPASTRPAPAYSWRERDSLAQELATLSTAGTQGGSRLPPERRADRVRQDLGLWAAQRLCRGQPPPAVVDGQGPAAIPIPVQAGEPAREVLDAAQRHGWLTAGDEFIHPGFALALAADHLLRERTGGPPDWCQRLVRWVAEADQPPPVHQELACLLVSWEPAVRAVVHEERQRLLEQNPDLLSTHSRQRTLQRLYRCDQLLGDQAATVPEEPACVRWAYRARLYSLVASYLEALPEERPAVLVRHYLAVAPHTDSGGRRALANAIRRAVARTGAVEALPDDLALPIRGALPDASDSVLEAIAQRPATFDLWLGVLPFPLSPAQLAAAVRGLTSPGAQRQLAAVRLAEEPDLEPVWAALGEARDLWVRNLPAGLLRLPNVVALARRLDGATGMGTAENRAYELLRSRLSR